MNVNFQDRERCRRMAETKTHSGHHHRIEVLQAVRRCWKHNDLKKALLVPRA